MKRVASWLRALANKMDPLPVEKDEHITVTVKLDTSDAEANLDELEARISELWASSAALEVAVAEKRKPPTKAKRPKK